MFVGYEMGLNLCLVFNKSAKMLLVAFFNMTNNFWHTIFLGFNSDKDNVCVAIYVISVDDNMCIK